MGSVGDRAAQCVPTEPGSAHQMCCFDRSHGSETDHIHILQLRTLPWLECSSPTLYTCRPVNSLASLIGQWGHEKITLYTYTMIKLPPCLVKKPCELMPCFWGSKVSQDQDDSALCAVQRFVHIYCGIMASIAVCSRTQQ